MELTVLEAKDVTFGYKDVTILHDINLRFEEPGLVCILGPNGVGKTTFAKCLNRLNNISGGSITIDGTSIYDMHRRDIAKHIAYVPNSASSVFSMTVYDSILLGRTPVSGYNVSKSDIEAVAKAIEELDLDSLAAHDVNQLSAGQTQRVSIARGLVQESPILILDEPTSNLDVRYQMEVMRFLRNYARDNGIIIIMVCHDLNITAAYADRVILMFKGTIYADGAVQDVLTAENLKTVYRIDSRIVQEEDGVVHILQKPI